MSITLSDGVVTLDLDPDLFWSDEFGWSSVSQTRTRGITGSLIVQSAALAGGRPITLEAPDDDSAWMARSTLDQLSSWAGVPELQLVLTLRGESREVQFRHDDETPAVSARPVLHFNDVVASDWYLVTVRFMEV